VERNLGGFWKSRAGGEGLRVKFRINFLAEPLSRALLAGEVPSLRVMAVEVDEIRDEVIAGQ